ncbi:hypothetical protein P3T27_004928 [Kitasatospora sp. MAA19]|uniref:transposase n=1 Tax=Kitasatospora sp. MAA19 TaxID=3035090 RepID=UPI002474C12C|nr:transposase [Kitasatospora sp. MAA19]MDH6708189.1 hypothetical protein [Kitasatospora sp. MAA19]
MPSGPLPWCTAHDYTDPGKPKIAWNDERARADLVDVLVRDALNLLGRLPEQELGEAAANAVGLLALVAGQDVEPADDSDSRDGRWQIARRTVYDRTVSTVDPEARHIHKNRTRHQEGYRAHVAFEPETGLFTDVALTAGSGAGNHEATVARDLLAEEELPVTVLGDSAYGTGDRREHLQAQCHDPVLKSPPPKPAVPGGFTADDFTVDTEQGQVTCPTGHTVPLGRTQANGARQAQFKKLCATCPLKDRCTRSKTGRNFAVHARYDLLKAARDQAATSQDWQAEYRRWRPPVERAIAWLVAKGNRRVPYRGVIENDTWLHHRAAALNLRRLLNLSPRPLAPPARLRHRVRRHLRPLVRETRREPGDRRRPRRPRQRRTRPRTRHRDGPVGAAAAGRPTTPGCADWSRPRSTPAGRRRCATPSPS